MVQNIFEAEGQSLRFLDERVCIIGSFPSFLFFLQTEQFPKQTCFDDSKLSLHIVQWYFATLITLSNVIGNYHIKSHYMEA